MSEMIDVLPSDDEQEWRLRLKKDLVFTTAKAFRDEVMAGIRGGLCLRLDLRDVRFMDSTGLGVLTQIVQPLRKLGGRLVLSHVNKSIRKTLEISRVLTLLEIEEAGGG